MPVDPAGAASEAREIREVYLAIVARDDFRLGIEVRWDGRLSLVLEGQVRLLPPGEVDPGSLEPVVRCLSGLAARGFSLHHFEDGWVLATRPVGTEEASAIIDAFFRLLEPEPINRC